VTLLGPATPTIAVRTAVLALAFSVPLVFGVWDRLADSLRDDRPTPTASAAERLVMRPLEVPPDPSYSFLATQPTSSQPVAFDPCRPIRYVVRPDGAPSGSDELLKDAITMVSSATGLQFVDAGSTSEAPSANRPSYLPDQYGDQWAPVLIAWSTAEEFPPLSGPVIGVAGSEPVSAGDDQLVRVSGQVVLDRDQITDVLRFTAGRGLTVATIAHELGHLVGLGHVDDARQLMYPSARPLVSYFGPGDLTGLAALGAGPCFSEL
jgi:hypothetical protein